MMVNDENRHQTWKQNTWGPPTSRVTYNKIKPLWQDPQCPALAVCCLSVQFLTCVVPLCLGTHWLLLNHVTRSHTCHSSNLTHILNQVPILFQSALYFTFETFRHYLLEFSQTHVYWAGDAIQPSHPLSLPSPPALNLSQHQGLFQWVISLHQVAKSLELQLQHQSFQWIFRVDFLWDWLVWSPCIQGTLNSLLQHHNWKASIFSTQPPF